VLERLGVGPRGDRAAVGDQMRELAGGRAGVGGHHRRPRAQDAEVGEHELDRGAAGDEDAVARAHAALAHPAAEARGGGVELTVGDLRVGDLQRGAVRLLGRGPVEGLGQAATGELRA
jgi:hypothetical protein